MNRRYTSVFLLFMLSISTSDLVAQVFDYAKQEKAGTVNNVQERERFRSIDDAFFGMSAGVALPLGQFASDDPRNFFSGYAEDGFYFSLLNGFQKFGRNLGIGLNWQRGQFGFNNQAFQGIYQDFFPQLEFNSRTDGDWIVHGFTGNFVVNVPHRIFDVDIRVGAGVGRVTRPEITLEGYENSTGFLSFSWVQAESIENDLLFGFGMNGRIHVSPTIDVLMQWDYQRMTTEMEILNIYALTIQESDLLEQQFEIFSFGIGLGIRID